METPCSAYRNDTICANGFLSVNPICTGRGPIGCFSCGAISRLPECLNADSIKYHADDAGMPILAHHRRATPLKEDNPQ